MSQDNTKAMYVHSTSDIWLLLLIQVIVVSLDKAHRHRVHCASIKQT